MRFLSILIFILLSISITIKANVSQNGFFNFNYNEETGKISLFVDKVETEFLYVNSLAAGVGSNDIGLDRGQLGNTRIVKFIKKGNKILLIQPNYDYRAISNNPDEKKAIKQAFAQSVLWGFEIQSQENNIYEVDLTPFLLRDAHGVAQRLQQKNQGNYNVDASRSAIHSEMCKNFPKNTEFESIITFTGTPKDWLIGSVTPSAEAITVQMHHSFIELPDNNYNPRKFDPNCGYFPVSFADYATPIHEPLVKRLIPRHRLAKKNPNAEMSEPVEPIVYYVDRGAPEPIKSALIEGASWWNQAFEAAGYKNAFMVKEMPADADPMDVRYNLIQWVHRSTRGWSYGMSVKDPRTGEIIKGHVSLGSLRVRQDFLIAQGLLSPYSEGVLNPDDELTKMALARLRQLSAHEVGHTIGLAHNFAASTNDRASVMDYPHPYITANEDGSLNFENAYAVGIGEWDKRTIMYGYQDFPKGTDEEKALLEIINQNHNMGFRYISDQDARPINGANPYGHLWDNGEHPAQELNRIMEVRKIALSNFGINSIKENTPMATLENVLAPLYLAHRYQIEATTKMIGGVAYSYANKGDNQTVAKILPANEQKQAFNSLMSALKPENLTISEEILNLIPPQPIGYQRDRELFNIHTGITFDPIGAAESIATHTIHSLLQHERLARIIEQKARDNNQMSLNSFFTEFSRNLKVKLSYTPMEKEIAMAIEKIYVNRLISLAVSKQGNQQVNAVILYHLNNINERLSGSNLNENIAAHNTYVKNQIERFKNHPEDFEAPKASKMPDGSPIGCSH